MKDQWDNRYKSDEFVYGTQPNKFFAEQLKLLKPGKLLLPAEGEGRNAVFAAQKNWEVLAFDFSNEARLKALKMVKKHDLDIEYTIASFDSFNAEKDSLDCIALIYAHIVDGNRKAYHQKLLSFLKPGGTIILEAFSKKQLGKKSGGPPKIDFLYSIEELEEDFSNLTSLEIFEERVQLSEGSLHQGEAEVIRLVGKK